MKELHNIPWPYNLVAVVNGTFWEPKPIDAIMTEDQQKGLEIALSNLPEEEKYCILALFRDKQNITSYAKQCSKSREWAMARKSRALRKLHESPLCSFVLNGYEYTMEMARIEERKKQLANERLRLDVLEYELNQRRDASIKKSTKNSEPEMQIEPSVGEPIENLDLSVRAYNALRKARCDTIDEIIKLGIAGTLARNRGIGQVTLEDIVRKLYAYTGVNLSTTYNISVEGIVPLRRS